MAARGVRAAVGDAGGWVPQRQGASSPKLIDVGAANHADIRRSRRLSANGRAVVGHSIDRAVEVI
jgi:hypothetical protein